MIMYKFINNYIEPITLSASTLTANLSLPDGKYRLTIADSANSATQWEIIDATVTGGAATLQRAKEGTSAQDWTEGSVIYNALTAETLNSILADIQRLKPDEPAGPFAIEIELDIDRNFRMSVKSNDPDAYVDMGDGTTYSEFDPDFDILEVDHRFSAGVHVIRIFGDYQEVYVGWTQPYKIISWGVPMIPAPSYSFENFVTGLPSTLPPWLTNLDSMLEYSRGFTQDLSAWDTSHVISMDGFSKNSDFNGNISGWRLESLVSARGAFLRNSAFNQDLSQWCVPLIVSEPDGFSTDAAAWTLPKPVWGTCPS